ncbi:MAG: tetratricopeptide repeat protein [Planctomycetaceae bacterium]
MFTLAEKLDAAVARHKSGDFAPAERTYREVLRFDPQHADALNLLGVVLHQTGRHVEAVGPLRRAVELAPHRADCVGNLAAAADSAGDASTAESALQRLAAMQPGDATVWFRLGNALKDLRRTDDAVAAFERALRVNPDFAEAHFNLANTFAGRNAPERAERHYREAIRIAPEFILAGNNLGTFLQGEGRFEEARDVLQATVDRQPDCVFALNNLGNACRELGETERAVELYRRAIAIDPQSAVSHDHLAAACRDLGELGPAERAARTALQIDGSSPKAWNNLGNILFDGWRFADAVSSYDKASVLDPGFALARCNRSLVRLADGDFSRGWTEYEARWELADHQLPRFDQPRWDGTDLRDRTILLDWEQGLGDTLQFVRYAMPAQRRGGRVIVRCQKPLAQLLQLTPGIDALVPDGAPLPDFDTWSPLLSLPRLFGTGLDTIPADLPYVFADPELVARWRPVVRQSGTLTIGIAWQGNPQHRRDAFRSIPLEAFAGLAEIPGVRLISVQKGAGSEQIAKRRGDWPLIDLGPQLDEQTGPFLDTAAVIANLDLVVSADTCIAHLAGAMGTPAYVVLCNLPEWRWMRDRTDTPWYPTMRLFRQRTPGDWGDAFARIAHEVRTGGPLSTGWRDRRSG